MGDPLASTGQPAPGPAPAGPVATDLADRLTQIYTGVVHDVMLAAGIEVRVLAPTVRPLDPATPLAGPVFTVTGQVDTSLDGHQTLLAWTEFLAHAPAGHVIVCQPNDSGVAHMGELSAETLQSRGVRGYIVDGGCRDTEFILSIGFPVWCRYTTPRDIRGHWVPVAYEQPVSIAGTLIDNGDYLMADCDGAIVIPERHVAEVTEAAEQALREEDQVRDAIRQGIAPDEAYRRYGRF